MVIFLAGKAVCYRILAFFCYRKLYFKCKSAQVLHFENGIEHKILITHVIAKVSMYIWS